MEPESPLFRNKFHIEKIMANNSKNNIVSDPNRVIIKHKEKEKPLAYARVKSNPKTLASIYNFK
jgi:hypothetical protein